MLHILITKDTTEGYFDFQNMSCLVFKHVHEKKEVIIANDCTIQFAFKNRKFGYEIVLTIEFC